MVNECKILQQEEFVFIMKYFKKRVKESERERDRKSSHRKHQISIQNDGASLLSKYKITIFGLIPH